MTTITATTTTSNARVRRLVLNAVAGIALAASAGTAVLDATPASAATAASAVTTAHRTLNVTTVQAVRIPVSVSRDRVGDRLVVQQYYARSWHAIAVHRVLRRLAVLRYTFGLGAAPAGNYLVRVVLKRNQRTVAATGGIRIYSRQQLPGLPPPPPPPA